MKKQEGGLVLELRDLDRAIAEWKGDRLIKRGKWKGYWVCGKGRHYADEDNGPMRYSSNPSAFWLLFETLVGMGHVVIVKGDGLRDEMKYTAMLDQFPRIDSDTAPLALCLVVKKWLIDHDHICFLPTQEDPESGADK